MKKTLFTLFLMLILVSTLCISNVFAKEYTKWNLPEGAITRLGKGNITGNIVYSPDGSRIAVASGIGIWLYNAQTGEELALFTEHKSGVFSVAFSLDGETLASAHRDEVVRLWSVSSRELLRSLKGHTSRVLSVVFSPDGETLASGGWDRTILWDVKTGELLHSLKGIPGGGQMRIGDEEFYVTHKDRVRSVAFSPDGETLVSAYYNKIWLWDVQIGEQTRIIDIDDSKEGPRKGGHTLNVVFSPDGETLASGGDDNTVRLLNAETGKQIHTFKGHEDYVSSVVFSPDGETLASGSHDNTIRLWNTKTGTHFRTLIGHEGDVSGVAFSPDGKTLASGSYDNTGRLWNVKTGELVRILEGHEGGVRSAAFSPDGKTLARDTDNTIRLWDVISGSHLRTFTGHESYVSSVAFSPDGTTLASGSYDSTIRLWNTKTGEQDKTIKKSPVVYRQNNWIRGDMYFFSSIVFSPDGETLASAENSMSISFDGLIRLWDVQTGNEIRIPVLDAHEGGVSSIVFSPDGETLASSSYDGTIRLWSMKTGKQIKTIKDNTIEETGDDHSSIVFSPDGETLASAGYYLFRLWDVKTGLVILTLTIPGQKRMPSVNGVIFSPDGNTLASGHNDNTVRLWNVKTGELVRILEGHGDHVLSVVFSPDGQTLASSSGDGTVLLWKILPVTN